MKKKTQRTENEQISMQNQTKDGHLDTQKKVNLCKFLASYPLAYYNNKTKDAEATLKLYDVMVEAKVIKPITW